MQPKVGLLLVAAKFFWNKKVHSFQSLPQLITSDAENIVNRLSERLEITNSGIVTSVAEAVRAIEEFKKEKIELLIICPLMWSEDQPLIKVVNEMSEVPLILWCYSPYKKLPSKMSVVDLFRGSGPVGTLQISEPLRRLKRKFYFVLGDTDEVIETISEYAEGAELSRELKNSKIGLLPYRCEVMTDTYVDEFSLMRQIGPVVKYISVAELLSASNKIKESDIVTNLNDLKRNYQICNVSEESLYKAVKVSLGLARIVDIFDLDAVAIDDISEELHRMIGLRPCLYIPALQEKKMVIGMEGDLSGTTALLLLSRLTGKPSMFAEIFNFDKGDNCILAGHAGLQNPELAKDSTQIKITPDYEYQGLSEFEGAWMQFIAKPGRVTLLQLVCGNNGFKMIIAGGEALESEERVEGFPHIYIKIDTPLNDFFTNVTREGVTHHWAIVYGDVRSKLGKLADLLELKKIIV